MSVKNTVSVAITGAAGQIGYATLFRIASGQMFGPDVAVNLHLLELEPALPALEGVVMELEDCALPLLKKIVYTSDLSVAMQQVNWALLVGSVPRKAGMERSDLLRVNGEIFTRQGKAIQQYAANDVKVFVVGNPCNTNALIAMHNAPDVPHDRFYAMTLLDENRARMQLAKKAGVDVSSITKMAIWGNHSATQFPDFESAKVAGRPVTEVITDQAWLEKDFITTVQQRGAAVIKARGASSAASAANAIVGSVYHLTHDTAENDYFSVAKYSNGEYGVDPGLIYSFPVQRKNAELTVIEGLTHSPFAQEKLLTTLNELKHEKEIVTSLGLIKDK